MSSRRTMFLLCTLVFVSYAYADGNYTILIPAATTVQPIPLKGDHVPPARVGAVLGTSKEGFVMLGGSVGTGDAGAWAFNASSATWHQLETKFNINGACAVQDDDFLYIYGGSDTKANNALQRYQISIDKLVAMNVTGSHPTTGLSCAFRNNTIYLFGGKTTGAFPISKYDLKAGGDQFTPVKETSKDSPANTVGASGVMYEDEFILWGGSTDVRVWRFNLLTSAWTVDQTNTANPPALSYASYAFDSLAPSPSFVIFGGSDAGGFTNNSWVYNLKNMTWSQLHPRGLQGFPSPRNMANSILSYGRFFIFSGTTDLLNTTGGTLGDFWEMVLTEDCLQRTKCDDCVFAKGCGWCASNYNNYQCIPGYRQTPFVTSDCSLDFSADLTICPPEGFRGWIVAIIIVAAILLIGVVWYLVIRLQKKSGGYEQIN